MWALAQLGRPRTDGFAPEVLSAGRTARFAQIHRGTIVNLRAVEEIERDVLGRSLIHLKNHSDVLAVSRAYARRFRQM